MFYEIHVFIALYISVASYKGKFQKSGHFCGEKNSPDMENRMTL